MIVKKMPSDGRCIFCGVSVLPTYLRNKEAIEAFIAEFGRCERSKHKLGGKPVCVSCCGDIWAIVQED